jgi:hypothetical protein
MEAKHRMKVKIGPNEFEAEGEADLVTKQYNDFIAIVSQMPKAAAGDQGPSSESDEEKPNDRIANGAISRAVLDRVFRQDEPLSLMDTPHTDNAEADALLVLIYGHTEMRGKPDVTGAALVKSASKTGLNIARISRTVDARREFIRSSGVKKGTRYSLNNRGIAEAKRLILAMVE